MRTLLFKAVKKKLDDFNSDIWVEGHLLNNFSIGEVGEGIEHYTYREIIPQTICQFIGLQDENKTNVFEGDKLKHHHFGVGVILWDDVKCSFFVKWDDGHRDIIFHVCGSIVIGNIHDECHKVGKALDVNIEQPFFTFTDDDIEKKACHNCAWHLMPFNPCDECTGNDKHKI